MTPESVQERKAAGLSASAEDVWWLIDLCEALAKGVAATDRTIDHTCAFCGGEEDHARSCVALLAEAALGQPRWRVVP